MRLGLAIAAAVALLDQLTKWWVVEALMRPEGVAETPFYSPRAIEVLPFLNIVMAWNRGVSFGLFSGLSDYNHIILSVLSLVIVAVLLVWLRRAEGRLVPAALGLIVGGALGNVIDRVRIGVVADFIDVHAFGWHWPAFNVADSAISVGAALLIADALFTRHDSHKNKP